MKKKPILFLAVVMVLALLSVFAACNKSDPKPLAAPEISASGNTVTWSAVDNATSYEVYVDGDKVATVNETSYTLNMDVGTYYVRVKAISSDTKKFTPSELSNSVTCTVSANNPTPLSAPQISANGNTVTWSAVPNATFYEVYADGEMIASLSATTYTLGLAFGAYTVQVKAIPSDTTRYTDSALSNSVTCTVYPDDPTPLAAPQISASGNTVTWSAVQNAASYEVYADESKIATVTETSYTLTLAVGNYSVQVKAIPSDTNMYANSELSNSVSCAIPKIAASIVKTGDVAVTEYWAGESSQLDLSGLTAAVHYLNSADEPIDLTAENIVSDYNLNVAGRYEIDFEYQGLVGVTVRIYVRERSDVPHVDVANYWQYVGGNWQFANDYYEISDGSITPTSAINSHGQSLAVTDGKVSKDDLSLGVNVLRISDGNTTVYSFVTVAYGITNKEGFESINDNLNGYYVLLNDLDFANSGVKIGNAPLHVTWEGTSPQSIALDRTGAGDTVDGNGASLNGALQGRAFNGTFDGQGHLISNYTYIQARSSWVQRYLGMGVGMFGWIGKNGTVKNFTMRSAFVRGDDYAAIVAGYNEGLIENVALEDDCTIRTYYSHGALVCAYNYGTVRNVVSNFSCGATNYSASVVFPMLRQDGDYMTETGSNCYVEPKTDLTSVLGDNWMYIDGYGMVYGTKNYTKLLSYDDEWVAGKQYKITMFVADESVVSTRYVHSWTGYSGAVTIYSTILKGNILDLYVGIPAFKATTGPTATVKVRFDFDDGQSYVCSCSVKLKTEVYYVEDATGEDGAGGGTVNTIVNAGIGLKNVPIKLVNSDGTNKLTNPTGYIENTYDASLKAVQNVTFYYLDGENYHYVVIKVKPEEPTEDFVNRIKVTPKEGVGVIRYWTDFPINFDQYFTFTLCHYEGAEKDVTAESVNITHSEYTPGHRTITFTYDDKIAGSVTADVEMDIWYVVRNADDWKLMNTYLDGYFMLETDVDLSSVHTDNSLVIGRAPLVNANEGYNIAADGVGTEQAGIAFVGKFNGYGHRVTGFNTDFTRNTGATEAWQPTSYALVPFAFIGEGGEVGDFVLEGANIKCGQSGSLLVGLNLGTVRNVVIMPSCMLFVHYGGANAGAIASVNGGTLQSITCQVDHFETNSTTINFTNIVYQTVGDGKQEDCQLVQMA